MQALPSQQDQHWQHVLVGPELIGPLLVGLRFAPMGDLDYSYMQM